MPGESADFEPSPTSLNTPFHGSGRVRAAVDGNEAKVCLHWKQGEDPTGGYSSPHGLVRRPSEEGLPESNIIAQLGGSLREIRGTWGVTNEAMAEIVPESWLEWGLGAEGDLASTAPEADMMAAHGVVTNTRKAQQKLSKLVNQGKHGAHTTLLEQRRHARRDRTIHQEEARPKPSPRLAKGAYKWQEPLHAFGRGQQTRF